VGRDYRRAELAAGLPTSRSEGGARRVVARVSVLERQSSAAFARKSIGAIEHRPQSLRTLLPSDSAYQLKLGDEVTSKQHYRLPMKFVCRIVFLAQIAGCIAPIAGSGAPVSFTNDIAPILVQKCMACHDDKKAKGGFQLQSFAGLMKGGKSKEPALIPGEAEKSKLYRLLIASDEDDRMPQKDDPLPTEQIALIRRWISEGAKFDGGDTNANLATFGTAIAATEPPAEYSFGVPIAGLAFSADGKKLISGGYHELLIWDADEGRLLRRVKGLPQKIQRLAPSPDGKWLAAATGIPGKLGQINLIEMESERPAKVLATAPDLFWSVVFSADGSAIAAGAADNTIRLLDFPSGRETLKIEQHADWVMDVAFHPDGKHLISASRDKTARLINRANGELESTYQGHTEAVFAVATNPKGDRILSAGRDKKIHIWETKEARKVAEITGFGGDIYQMIATEDRILAAGADKGISEYRTDEKRELIRKYEGHRDAIFGLVLSRDGKRLASGGFDGEIRIWNTESGELVRAFMGAPGRGAASTASLHNAH
jgi:hypothetical protein